MKVFLLLALSLLLAPFAHAQDDQGEPVQVWFGISNGEITETFLGHELALTSGDGMTQIMGDGDLLGEMVGSVRAMVLALGGAPPPIVEETPLHTEWEVGGMAASAHGTFIIADVGGDHKSVSQRLLVQRTKADGSTEMTVTIITTTINPDGSTSTTSTSAPYEPVPKPGL